MQQLHPVELTEVYIENQNSWFSDPVRQVFLGDKQLTKAEVVCEEEQRVLMHDLYLGAQSLKLALKFVDERKEYFESLYDFSYGVSYLSDLTDPSIFIGTTESHAMRIIDEKEAYDKRIKKLLERYRGFKKIIGGLREDDQDLLIRYFEYGHKLSYELIRECIHRLCEVNTKELDEFF